MQALDLLMEYVDNGKPSSYTKGLELLENVSGICEKLRNNPGEVEMNMILSKINAEFSKQLLNLGR
jgi:hypothetical protein